MYFNACVGEMFTLTRDNPRCARIETGMLKKERYFSRDYERKGTLEARFYNISSFNNLSFHLNAIFI